MYKWDAFSNTVCFMLLQSNVHSTNGGVGGHSSRRLPTEASSPQLIRRRGRIEAVPMVRDAAMARCHLPR